ncbi:GNAT family N-acetyltransferase [Jeotgalibacillus haloalkalitolerans]|uniref:GNAT family N-acetyltransferase n=1 Tax=Jeotgalibacillus haloalkalitolerans TaxID=3104292 RepID=A0ABU5KN13_9BACL|nr:GNAT family N-acetyltransferase [Jeotgalibacillus sp. HH7-29]MDZ5712655.1 GNAT family N-acetyltransferase [Jeotgalibacillus sp. HH7-29]
MKKVVKASVDDLDQLVEIDSEVIGNTSRKDFIKNAIEAEACLIALENDEVAGYLIYDTHFFGCSFISMIIVSPAKRRKGFASLLMNHMVSHSETEKVFSSANRSNHDMQKVFEANGFVESGVIENLDEGDPEIVYFKSVKEKQ